MEAFDYSVEGGRHRRHRSRKSSRRRSYRRRVGGGDYDVPDMMQDFPDMSGGNWGYGMYGRRFGGGYPAGPQMAYGPNQAMGGNYYGRRGMWPIYGGESNVSTTEPVTIEGGARRPFSKEHGTCSKYKISSCGMHPACKVVKKRSSGKKRCVRRSKTLTYYGPRGPTMYGGSQ